MTCVFESGKCSRRFHHAFDLVGAFYRANKFPAYSSGQAQPRAPLCVRPRGNLSRQTYLRGTTPSESPDFSLLWKFADVHAGIYDRSNLRERGARSLILAGYSFRTINSLDLIQPRLSVIVLRIVCSTLVCFFVASSRRRFFTFSLSIYPPFSRYMRLFTGGAIFRCANNLQQSETLIWTWHSILQNKNW